MLFFTNLLRAGSSSGFVPDTLGAHIHSLAAQYRTTVNSGTLVNGVTKIRAAR